MTLAVLSPAAQRRLSGVPVKYRQKYLSAVQGKASPRESIRAMCLECMGYDTKEITSCSSDACPLWHHRPYR